MSMQNHGAGISQDTEKKLENSTSLIQKVVLLCRKVASRQWYFSFVYLNRHVFIMTFFFFLMKKESPYLKLQNMDGQGMPRANSMAIVMVRIINGCSHHITKNMPIQIY